MQLSQWLLLCVHVVELCSIFGFQHAGRMLLGFAFPLPGSTLLRKPHYWFCYCNGNEINRHWIEDPLGFFFFKKPLLTSVIWEDMLIILVHIMETRTRICYMQDWLFYGFGSMFMSSKLLTIFWWYALDICLGFPLYL